MLTDEQLTAFALMEPAAVVAEIATRLGVLKQMVGTLYPGIVATEIAQLQAVLAGVEQPE